MMIADVSKLTEICFRILLCLFGILGNSTLLFFTIPAVNRKIEPYKILLISLACSDLLTNCMVDIPGILVKMYGTWFLGDSYCKIFWFTASLSVTNSILTTLAMSIFWFRKLVGSRPVNCPIFRTAELRFLRKFVSLSWLISAVFSLPLLVFCRVNMLKNEEEEHDKEEPTETVFGCHKTFPSRFEKNVYEVLYLVFANALPILGMFFMNVRIIIFLIRSRRRVTVLKCLKTNKSETSLVPGCGEHGTTKCQLTGGQIENKIVTCVSSVPCGLQFALEQTIWTTKDNLVTDNVKNVDKRHLIKRVLNSLERDPLGDKENNHPTTSKICNTCNYKENTTKLYDLNTTHLAVAQETNLIFVDGKTYNPDDAYSTSVICTQDQCVLRNVNDKLPELLKNFDTKGVLEVKSSSRYSSSTRQVRAAISIMAVVGVFFIFWVTHLTLSIKEETNSSQHIINTASIIAASYTTVIPYIFLYSMKKCPCG